MNGINFVFNSRRGQKRSWIFYIRFGLQNFCTFHKHDWQIISSRLAELLAFHFSPSVDEKLENLCRLKFNNKTATLSPVSDLVSRAGKHMIQFVEWWNVVLHKITGSNHHSLMCCKAQSMCFSFFQSDFKYSVFFLLSFP